MRCVVTGAAGFVGSHLCEHLLAHGDDVVALDSFTDYYPVETKEANIAGLVGRDRFHLHRMDIRSPSLHAVIDGADVVFHLAGQPGVRPSWGGEFPLYVERNVLATQALLETVRAHPVRKVVYASSSSVYGDAETYPTSETLRPAPVSPYGVTKLAAEHLCALYRRGFGVPTASLRLFTVYGPRQRPDMAFSRLIGAALRERPFELFGDGTQTRDFTFVHDVVHAMRQAALSDWTGVANIGGGSRTSMNQVIDTVRALVGDLHVVRRPVQRGDVADTAADTTAARDGFGYHPRVSLGEGLASMVDAMRVADLAA